MRSRWTYLLSGLAVVASTLACFSDEEGAEIEARTGGNSASGYFLVQPSYIGLTGAPINIAQGARYNATVWDWEDINTHQSAQLTAAASSDEAIVKIVERRGDTLILEGVSSGEASITITGTSDTEVITDVIYVSVALARVAQFDEPCGSTHLVSGKDNYITHSFRDSNGGVFYGYGLDYLSANPGDGQVLLDLGTERLQVVRVGEEVMDSISLQDKILMQARPTLVTAPAPIIKLQVYPEQWGLTGTIHPAITPMVAKATLQTGEETCPVLKYKLSSKTPALCSLENILDAKPTDPQQPTTLEKVRLVTKAAGKCVIALIIAEDADFGVDNEFTFEVDIAPAPPRERETTGSSSGDSDFD